MEEDCGADDNLDAAVERALVPYLTLLPADQLDEFRAILREELARHPVSARLLKQLRPPPVVEKSDDVVRDDPLAAAPGQHEDNKDKRRERGGRR